MKISDLIGYIFVISIAAIVMYVIILYPHNEVQAAPLLETEFTTHRKIDNELGIVCYTTVMLKNSEISELTMSCVPLPATCNYGEKKVSNEKIQNWSNY